jgi:hypothetical protein
MHTAIASIAGAASTSASEAMATSISLLPVFPTGWASLASNPAGTISRIRMPPSGSLIASERDGRSARGAKPCGMAAKSGELLEIDICGIARVSGILQGPATSPQEWQ